MTKTMAKAIDWLNKNKKQATEIFDFPDYCGMPKSISSRLSVDEVDWIQGQIE